MPSLLGLASIRFDSTRFFPFLRASAVILDLARCFVLLFSSLLGFPELGFVFLLVHDLYLDRICFFGYGYGLFGMSLRDSFAWRCFGVDMF